MGLKGNPDVKGGNPVKRVIPANEPRFQDFGWPEATRLPPFSGTVDPQNMQFGGLRVFNDDGAASHEKSMGNRRVARMMNIGPEGAFLPPEGFTTADARALQEALAGKVSLQDALEGFPSTVAGVDVSVRRGPLGEKAAACIAVMEWGTWKPLQVVSAMAVVRFPYVPGLLSFRELPVILEAAKGLSSLPGLFLVDGAGLAHPRYFGLACHLGLALGCSSIGVAKSRLVGSHDPLPEARGSRVPLLVGGGKVAGTVLRTRSGVRPLYVSPGHGVSIETAACLVLAACPRYRLPEPIRLAHKLAGEEAFRILNT
jgi:deoxyribonuclease V